MLQHVFFGKSYVLNHSSTSMQKWHYPFTLCLCHFHCTIYYTSFRTSFCSAVRLCTKCGSAAISFQKKKRWENQIRYRFMTGYKITCLRKRRWHTNATFAMQLLEKNCRLFSKHKRYDITPWTRTKRSYSLPIDHYISINHGISNISCLLSLNNFTWLSPRLEMLAQWSRYGPRAKSGPEANLSGSRNHFIRPQTHLVNNEKIIFKGLMISWNVTFPERITWRKMSSARIFVQQFVWPSGKNVWRPLS